MRSVRLYLRNNLFVKSSKACFPMTWVKKQTFIWTTGLEKLHASTSGFLLNNAMPTPLDTNQASVTSRTSRDRQNSSGYFISTLRIALLSKLSLLWSHIVTAAGVAWGVLSSMGFLLHERGHHFLRSAQTVQPLHKSRCVGCGCGCFAL